MLKFWPIMMIAVALSGCVSRKIQQGGFPGAANSASGIYVAPFHNATPSPSASRALTEITTTTLLAHGLPAVQSEAATARAYQLIEENGHGDMLGIAGSLRASHALLGTVHEYRFKSDLDGAPTVGMTLRLVEVGSGMTVWQGTGSQSGSYYGSLSQTAQGAVEKLVLKMTGRSAARFAKSRSRDVQRRVGPPADSRYTTSYRNPPQSAAVNYQAGYSAPPPSDNLPPGDFYYQQTGYRSSQEAKPGFFSRAFGRNPKITRESHRSTSSSRQYRPGTSASRNQKPWVEYEQIRRRGEPAPVSGETFPPVGTSPPGGTYPVPGSYPTRPPAQPLPPPVARHHYDPIYTPAGSVTSAPAPATPVTTQQSGWTPSSY